MDNNKYNNVNNNMNSDFSSEPNFVMVDSDEPDAKTYTDPDPDPFKVQYEEPEETQSVHHEQTAYGQQSVHHDNSEGLYKDPRDNFRHSQSRGHVKSARQQRQKPAAKPITLTKKSLALIVALLLVVCTGFAVGSSIITSAIMSGPSSTSGRDGSVDKNHNYTLEDATNSSMSIADIAEKTRESVVEIRTESVSSDIWMQQYVTEGAGSGVIITKDGYVMTNNHVIEGASKITVTTTDEKQHEAKLVGTDELNDVAVLKIKGNNFSAATYGNSDQLEVGDLAVAIGNPLGELGGSVTSGIISARDREIALDGKTLNLLQTDTSINPGNSGGGLFNDDGQLIGLVVAKSSGSEIDNIGFAIPINTAADVAEQLMKTGHVSAHANTGMAYQEASDGVYIAQVNGKNAKKAGFKVGDRVLALENTEIDSFNTLKSVITSKKPGDKVKYTIVRDGQIYEIDLELEEKAD